MKKVFWGLFFILSGTFVVVDHVFNYTGVSIGDLLLTILLVAIFIKSLTHANFFGIFFSTAVLGILYSEQLQLDNITPYPILLAAFLASIGFTILFSKNRIYKRCHFHGNNKEHFDQIIDGKDDDKVNVDTNFGSTVKYVNSDDFKVASLRCSFGAMKVYFDNAKIQDDKAVINLDVSFSGVEIFIPRDWEIVDKVDTSLGSIEIRNNYKEKSTKTVTLKGKVSLSGVEIIYI